MAGANASALGPSLTVNSDVIHVVRHNVLLFVPTMLCRCTKRRSIVREDLPVQVSWPAPTRRPVARPSLTMHILHVARHNVLLYVPTTLCRCTKRRSMVGDYVPAQASWPAPTRRPLTRTSLTMHIINVEGHNERCMSQHRCAVVLEGG